MRPSAFLLLGCASAGLFLPGPAAFAAAQGIAADVVQCGGIGDRTARLACFDALVPTARKTDAQLRAEAQARAAKEFGLTPAQRAERDAPKMADKVAVREEPVRVESTLASVAMSEVSSVFSLANGQVWQTTSYGQLNTVPRAGQKVTISPGPLGGYRLVLDGKSRELGVKRLR